MFRRRHYGTELPSIGGANKKRIPKVFTLARSLSWRTGIKVALFTSILVLVTNVVLLIIAACTHDGYRAGTGIIHQGQRERISRLTTLYHILINILSTGLLTSSNYCMQLLSAPTRSDIDKAHSQGQWLDIGILSFRNLRYIPKRRVILWLLLAVSSWPLHLL